MTPSCPPHPPAHLLQVGGLPGAAPLRPRRNFPEGGGGVKLENGFQRERDFVVTFSPYQKRHDCFTPSKSDFNVYFYSLGIPRCRSKPSGCPFSSYVLFSGGASRVRATRCRPCGEERAVRLSRPQGPGVGQLLPGLLPQLRIRGRRERRARGR